ncbi:SRPBCC domain-containing protein [Synoicihabitans lomoniglobus]|uniref:SRPBCC domain-containing protein n=1 Tax=Synoicihabitans lomoniglobus TaxID=2909285 RepID=A0AAE9ZQV5_9BACT|nr:SRPBCC domain-containing protein [Opitutaceae bacterium LMO-M01]WED63465.1 SRPBCC domain-containing protein [Opitutaceae bacterium LMO-M01]
MSTKSTNYTIPAAASPAHEIVSTRVIPYARSHVFAAWTHPGLHAQWWGPEGFTNTFHTYDVRPGGDWRFVMHGPDGTNYDNESVFDHVVAGECTVFRHVGQPEFTAVVHFTDDGDGTRIEWHMIFATAEICAALTKMVESKNEENFDRLEAVLRDNPVDSMTSRELVVLREIEAPPEVVYRVMTTRTGEWWCPRPWTTPVVEWELRAGGRSHMVMRGPDGEEHDIEGVFLEVTENERIVFTDAYQHGWRPTAQPFMTGIFELSPLPGGRTSYRACSRHWSAAKCAEHVAMGFHPGWGAVADQLIEVVADELKQSADTA